MKFLSIRPRSLRDRQNFDHVTLRNQLRWFLVCQIRNRRLLFEIAFMAVVHVMNLERTCVPISEMKPQLGFDPPYMELNTADFYSKLHSWPWSMLRISNEHAFLSQKWSRSSASIRRTWN